MTIYCDDPLRKKTVSSLARNAIVNSILLELERTVLCSREDTALKKIKALYDSHLSELTHKGKHLVKRLEIGKRLKAFSDRQKNIIFNLTAILDYIEESETPRLKTKQDKPLRSFYLKSGLRVTKDSRYNTYTDDGRPAIQIKSNRDSSCTSSCSGCWWKTICEREGSRKLSSDAARVIQNGELRLMRSKIMVSTDQAEAQAIQNKELTDNFNFTMARMELTLDGKPIPQELMTSEEKREKLRRLRNQVDGVNYA